MASDTNLAPLPFGIPQLDDLLGYQEFGGEHFTTALETDTSLAIVGQDGTGKSVFALHLASAYHALNYFRSLCSPGGRLPLVFYVSSDFRYGAARKVWHNFALDYPWQRYAPFAGLREIGFRRQAMSEPDSFLHVDLVHCLPTKPASTAYGSTWVTQHIEEHARSGQSPTAASVAFLDMASTTTGDDWLFLARLLASVPKHPASPPNLLIIDSVAGFETLVGDRNSFGENMTRRAKIAQLIRVASPNWHTVFLVEEPEEGKHHPEEYVTDTVIHLVRQGKSDRIRRVLEIEKCRARSFGRGEHPFEIRDGFGSSTGGWENPDDPMALVHDRCLPTLGIDRKHHAYIQVFPSLHYLSGNFSRGSHLTRPLPDEGGPISFAVPFGVPYLDASLAQGVEDSRGVSTQGLPPGKVTSLIGDEGTLKNSLAEQFLLEGFRYFTEIFSHVHAAVGTWMNDPTQDIWSAIRKAGPTFSTHHGKQVSKVVCDRVQQSPGTWLDNEHFVGQRDAVREVGRASRNRALTRVELEHWAELRKRPLSARRDVELFYTSNAFERHLMQLGIDRRSRSDAYRQLMLTLSVLRSSSGFLTPVVFLSTHDASTERLADRILGAQWSELSNVLLPLLGKRPSESLTEVCRHGIVRVLERFIIVRRLELVDASSQQLWQITRECVTHALHLVGNLPTLDVAPPKYYPGEVRVVISDLRLLRDTYPEVADDPLFLPTIVFRLRRLGVTTLLVDSDLGRPDQNATHAMNGALRSLVDHQIYTWKVPFFGEQRVAISVLPPIMAEQPSAIRELKLVQRRTRDGHHIRRVEVDPHFELYSGLEAGNPSAVPLEVVFYGETAAFDQYVAEERAVFERLFSPVDSGKSIIDVRKAADYHSLRDYCHLPADTKLPHTLVFMIDGYWALTRAGALRSQREYLGSRLDARFSDGRTDYMDVFGLFGKTRRHVLAESDRQAQHPGGVNAGAEELFEKRGDFFPNAPFSRDSVGDVNRVPFMWDFGFLMCHEESWRRALTVPLPSKDGWRVHHVWDRLTRIEVDDAKDAMRLKVTQGHRGDPVPESDDLPGVGWRDFLEACTVVAVAEHARTGRDTAAFDFFTGGVDSLIALFMEIWFSEILRDALRIQRVVASDAGGAIAPETAVALEKARLWAAEALNHLRGFSSLEPTRLMYLQDLLWPQPTLGDPEGSRASSRLSLTYSRLAKTHASGVASGDTPQQTAMRFASLQGEIPGYSLQWYKAWLLLVEALDLRQYFKPDGPFEFKPRDPSFNAVASRHWYRTACEAAQRSAADGDHVTRVPVRFPGHFSVRSGWYLAVAKASRSYRLADRALDILSSRRANRSRLHKGLGLPTRDIPGFAARDGAAATSSGPTDRVLTGLIVARTDSVHRVSYHELLQLGGRTGQHGPSDFRWLLRSRFRDYDRQARVVRRWMNRVFAWSVQYRYQARSTWRSGFFAYDEIGRGDLSKVSGYPSFNALMPGFLDGFVDELNVAIDGRPEKEADDPEVSPPV